ncbi:MAG: NAD+ synthase, partial [Actinomycetota bacterium]|nr:NAD+ synthase [Actinomycetota bacterium]
MAPRIALVQANATVGALEANADLVLAWAHRAYREGADLVVFPEMFLTGYPVEDLALRESFIEASRARLAALPGRLAEAGLGSLTVVVGFLDRDHDAPHRTGSPRHSPQNAAAVIRDGAVLARYAKHHLPNYGVFDEFRYFVPGRAACQFEVA